MEEDPPADIAGLGLARRRVRVLERRGLERHNGILRLAGPFGIALDPLNESLVVGRHVRDPQDVVAPERVLGQTLRDVLHREIGHAAGYLVQRIDATPPLVKASTTTLKSRSGASGENIDQFWKMWG